MIIETNIDDMNPEIYSYLAPRLFDNGALDVFLTNIIMKKSRPGVKISVLCKEEEANVFEEILFNETTTLGIRKYKVERESLERESVPIKTRFGVVTIKKAVRSGKILKYAPEYEECRKIAQKYNLPLKDVYQEILIAINKSL